jgi:hypothetical protein
MEPIQVCCHLPDYLSKGRGVPLVLWLAGLVLLACGCTVRVPVQPEVGALEVKDKLPIVTALLVTQETQGYVFHGYPENLTAGGRWHDFLLGDALEKASLQAFSRVFQQVSLVRTEADAKRFHLAIEPTIEDFHFRYDQVSYGPFRTGVLSITSLRSSPTRPRRSGWARLCSGTCRWAATASWRAPAATFMPEPTAVQRTSSAWAC